MRRRKNNRCLFSVQGCRIVSRFPTKQYAGGTTAKNFDDCQRPYFHHPDILSRATILAAPASHLHELNPHHQHTVTRVALSGLLQRHESLQRPRPRSGQTPKGLYSCPDLLVVCGELKFHDEHRDVLLNRAVIIEALSPATEAFDCGEKWTRYQTWLPEFSDYLLVSQSKPQLDCFHCRTGGEWFYTLATRLDGSLQIASIGCTLQLSEVYDRIAFPSEEPESPGEE